MCKIESSVSFVSFSIIIPVFNVENYISECLNSVARQAYSGSIECILVDDCSTDKSISIAEGFIEQYQGPIEFRILHKEHNEGLSAARNFGLNNAKGDYVYFIDSDDYILDNSLSSIVSALDRYPDSDIVLSEYTKLENGELGYTRCFASGLDYIRREEIFSRDIWNDGYLVVEAWNKLIKRSWLIDNNIWFDNGRISEDLIWTFKTIAARPSIAYNHTVTYIYRIREGSITTSLSNKLKYRKWIESSTQNYIDMVNIYKSKEIDCYSLKKHILWSKFDLLKQASTNENAKKNMRDVCEKIRNVKFLPYYKMPLKHVFLDLLVNYCPVKTIVFLFNCSLL